jgi:Cys-rich protein (TIGR01571 family)
MWRFNFIFVVSQPPGGVQTGQTLRVPLLDSLTNNHKGQWKDGIFSCFRLGLCHPSVCNAWVCPQILLGQILTRLNMSWLATPSQGKSPQMARKLCALLVLVGVYELFLARPVLDGPIGETGQVFVRQSLLQTFSQVLYLLMSISSSLYGVLVVVKLRAMVRLEYGIPTGRLGSWEDVVYVCCCNCCVMSQLARQTADYDDTPASCCSPTGTKQAPADYADEDDGRI